MACPLPKRLRSLASQGGEVQRARSALITHWWVGGVKRDCKTSEPCGQRRLVSCGEELAAIHPNVRA